MSPTFLREQRPRTTWPAIATGALAALYILLPYQRVFTGPKPEEQVADLGGREKTVMGLLIAAMLVLGFFPSIALDAVNPVAEQYASTLMVTAEGSTK